MIYCILFYTFMPKPMARMYKTPTLPKIKSVWLLLLLLVACKPEPPVGKKHPVYYLPPEVKQYFFHKAGDTLIYRDSITGWYDTAVCVRGGYAMQISMIGDLVLDEEEVTQQTFRHDQYSKTFYYRSRVLFKPDGTAVCDITENGSDILMRFPLVLGDSLPNGLSVGHSIVKAFFPSIIIDGKEFRDVYMLQRRVVKCRASGSADYYLAKNKGIVAIRDYKDNKLWVLQ